jgi:HTH-type transcriptional regulator / antitoxin MqsA
MMKCSIQGCSGHYQKTTITRTVRHQGRLVVIDHVPAEVCDVCGDVLLSPQAAERIERILISHSPPVTTAPVYEYAA